MREPVKWPHRKINKLLDWQRSFLVHSKWYFDITSLLLRKHMCDNFFSLVSFLVFTFQSETEFLSYAIAWEILKYMKICVRITHLYMKFICKNAERMLFTQFSKPVSPSRIRIVSVWGCDETVAGTLHICRILYDNHSLWSIMENTYSYS